MVHIKVKRLNRYAKLPQYATEGASAFDLVSLYEESFEPGETKLVHTGLAMEIPSGYELQVRPRSGMSLKTNLRVSNSPGTVDSDYRGEICVIMTNTSANHRAHINSGDRVAQGAICPVVKADFQFTDELGNTDRGEGGFGSTGQ